VECHSWTWALWQWSFLRYSASEVGWRVRCCNTDVAVPGSWWSGGKTRAMRFAPLLEAKLCVRNAGRLLDFLIGSGAVAWANVRACSVETEEAVWVCLEDGSSAGGEQRQIKATICAKVVLTAGWPKERSCGGGGIGVAQGKRRKHLGYRSRLKAAAFSRGTFNHGRAERRARSCLSGRRSGDGDDGQDRCRGLSYDSS